MCQRCKSLERKLEGWMNDYFKLLEREQRTDKLNKVLKEQIYMLQNENHKKS